MTPRETEHDFRGDLASTLPPDPKTPTDLMPGAGELRDLTRRFGELSDALHAPEGLVHRLFDALDTRASERHAELMDALRSISNGYVELSARVQKLETKRLTNGNGVGHP